MVDRKTSRGILHERVEDGWYIFVGIRIWLANHWRTAFWNLILSRHLWYSAITWQEFFGISSHDVISEAECATELRGIYYSDRILVGERIVSELCSDSYFGWMVVFFFWVMKVSCYLVNPLKGKTLKRRSQLILVPWDEKAEENLHYEVGIWVQSVTFVTFMGLHIFHLYRRLILWDVLIVILWMEPA